MKNFLTSPVLTVAVPPHIHCGKTVKGLSLHTIYALIPAILFAVAHYGIDAIRVMALSCAVAVVTEYLCAMVMEQEAAIDDLSSVVIGLIFAFILPASAPWWLVVMGSVSSIALGKMIFGGIGGAPVCAAALGWAICRVSWPHAMDIEACMLSAPWDYPLGQLKHFGVEYMHPASLVEMFFGNQLGWLGASQVGAVLLGGIYLLWKGWLRPYIPIAFLVGVFIGAFSFYDLDPTQYASPIFHLFAGGTVFAAFFLATDPSSSPSGSRAMILYGLLGGVLTVIIRVYGKYPDGVVFAVLLANLFAPLIERIRPKPFGAR
ncbi:RnfABCDGE type electron transport complex subunit D [Desulfovibrio inopinatus]|uniref:RnfABCDGE type electron transport complex subunit D n=1 Tax=Desulfovibrio inopinatus TaxID=102109 RepID=UPI000409191C|nr:RnfABCDGE type electron transport complex subunit D [Desulfovibrio inopinatus]